MTSSRGYPRTARLNELVHQIVADELERVDDNRLEMVTITSVVVTPDLRRATVYFDTLRGNEDDSAALSGLTRNRVRLQRAIARQAHLKRTPELHFAADDTERRAAQVDDILRGLHGEHQ